MGVLKVIYEMFFDRKHYDITWNKSQERNISLVDSVYEKSHRGHVHECFITLSDTSLNKKVAMVEGLWASFSFYIVSQSGLV